LPTDDEAPVNLNVIEEFLLPISFVPVGNKAKPEVLLEKGWYTEVR
jgi:Kef-type K+ transport system membrane component KefB